MNYMSWLKNYSTKNIVEYINGEWHIEMWRAIENTEYLVSSFGRIKRKRHINVNGTVRQEAIRKICLAGRYLRISLRKGKTTSIHRLVCKSFHPNPENKPQVNHLDTIKYNNFYLNLAWSTQSENIIHAQNAGIYPFAKPKTKMPLKKRGLPKGDIKLFKPIIDLNTGIFYTSEELCFILDKRNRTVGRILREERKPNTTQYRYC